MNKPIISKAFFNENILPVISALILATPFLFYSAGWLSFVCLVPFLYYLDYVSKAKSGKKYLLSIWAVGAIFFFVVAQWLINTRPDNWAYIEGWQGGIGLLIIYLILVFFFSMQFLIFGFLYRKLKINLFSKWTFVVLPAVWVVSEFFRSVLFSIISYGPNGSIGPYWNFGVLGFGAGITPVGFCARIVGLFGLSFVVVVINLAIFWLLHRRWKLPAVVLVVVAMLSLFGWLLFDKANGSDMSVSIVQLPPTQDNSLTTNYQTDLKNIMASQSVSPDSVDLLLLPEYSEFFTAADPAAKELTKNFLSKDGKAITSISGEDSANQDGSNPSNDLVVYNQEGEITARHQKQFLIPVGEFMPYVIEALLRITGQGEALEINKATQNVKKGEKVEPPVMVAGKTIGALACSGAIAPELYRSMVVQGAEVLTNSASLGTFTNAPLYHAQTRQMARFNAIANARPYIQASTGAYSYAINANGTFIYRTTKTGLNHQFLTIQSNKNQTIFSKFGEWVVFVSLILVGTLLVRAYARK